MNITASNNARQSDDNEPVGVTVTEIRKAIGISKRQMASMLGVPEFYVAGVEKSKAGLPATHTNLLRYIVLGINYAQEHDHYTTQPSKYMWCEPTQLEEGVPYVPMLLRTNWPRFQILVLTDKTIGHFKEVLAMGGQKYSQTIDGKNWHFLAQSLDDPNVIDMTPLWVHGYREVVRKVVNQELQHYELL